MYIHKAIHICKAIALGAVVLQALTVFAEDDPFAYQTLTNLGPCASSRVLLMNNDRNAVCPIEGQGYFDASNTVAAGQTYWWHDDTPVTENSPKRYINLQAGVNHILYWKSPDGGEPVKLWKLVNCRAGSAAIHYNTTYNYLPWSSTCQPINPDMYSAPIPAEWSNGAAYSNGVKQVAVVTMRAEPDATIYSPLYPDGIGDIYFDAVNITKSIPNSHIAVEIATSLKEGEEAEESEEPASAPTFETETDMSKLEWERVACEVFRVEKGVGCEKDAENDGKTELRMAIADGYDNKWYRIRVSRNYRGPARFRIVRTDLSQTTTKDWGDLILVDNIVVSYPVPTADLTPTGIEADGVEKAHIGRVGAFSEPMLSQGLEDVKPFMEYSVNTNGLPEGIDWKVVVTNADFVWRWHYLDQAYGPWETNGMSVAEDGSMLVGDEGLTIPDLSGDLEYYYVADIVGSYYKYLDYGNDSQAMAPPDSGSHSIRYGGPSGTNYWSRIRDGYSLWQEMDLVAEVVTNSEERLSVTNRWTMELISDHLWRGFIETPTNYAGCKAHIRVRGKNLWATNSVEPVAESKMWYFPVSDPLVPVTEIPLGGVAVTNAPAEEQDVLLDCSSGYLILEMNDVSGAFTLNRAEYQNFNKWTPQDVGQAENKYIGDYMSTSYVSSVKQSYNLDMSKLPLSRSTSSYWWENFDQAATLCNPDYPFDVPFGLNKGTPNGWTANNGMFINGMFSAATNRTTYGMALQLKGRGIGSISLIDPADVPAGIGTVSFTARLAQYLEFGDFCYNADSAARQNYAISAKAAMTHMRQANCDVSTGSPALSLVTYYRPGVGCYEFRVSRVYSTYNNLWDAKGVMEIAIYKWSLTSKSGSSSSQWECRKLKSLRLGGDGTAAYNPQYRVGRYYTNSLNSAVQYQNYLVPPASGTNPTNNSDWTSMYFAAYNTSGGTYLEGGVGGTYSTASADTDLKNNNIMMSIDVTDVEKSTNSVSGVVSDAFFKRGAYGVCTKECPGTFGNINIHALSGRGSYKTYPARFGAAQSEKDNIADDCWGSISPNRIIKWADMKDRTGVDYVGTYSYGLCAAPIDQTLYLRFAKYGNSSDWTDKLQVPLSSYLPELVVFAPHTTEKVNVQVAVGGADYEPRTDVVVDNLQISQWAADDSSQVGVVDDWAYTDAWIAGSTNDVYQGSGSADNSDPVGYVTKCGYYYKKLSETDYIYVFTNTTAGALGSYATFVPKVDITIKEAFILGAGGGGGPGGGGGGGGGALWITNSVDYTAGETGMRIYVGNGGSGGTVRRSNNDVRPSGPGNGGTSYMQLKNPFTLATSTYNGYGGYRAGWFYRDNNTYAAGSGSSTGGGTGGGSALITSGHNPGSTIMNSALHTYGREIYGAGYGGAAVDGAPGGGGGGGLRGLGSNGANGGAGTAANPISVISPGSDGEDGTGTATGGKGGDGFPLSALGDSEIRTAIGELLGDDNAWLGGGGGGGSGENLEANVSKWGHGATSPGPGGKGGGGQGGLYTAGDYNNYQAAMGYAGTPFTGGGGGGGTFWHPVTSGTTAANNWIIGGGAGGGGLVVMHVRVKDRFVMLQPMRGSATEPMSVRTPFLNGISVFGFSWKWADTNALLKVQICTNNVDDTSVRTYTTSLENGWTDVCDVDFSKMSDSDRVSGSTNILVGLRAPVSGLVRILADPEKVGYARIGSTNDLDSMYGTVIVSGMQVLDAPALDDRSWWGWNIMPTYSSSYGYIADYVDGAMVPARSCALNFAGINDGIPANDPEFSDESSSAGYNRHDPFVQTPRFTNSIGLITFKARVLETNLTQSAWVSISGCENPSVDEAGDPNWVVLTNIEITAGTTRYAPYQWRIPRSHSTFQALRLTAFAAAEGRYNQKDSFEQFGGNGTTNPVPIQRVLLDEVVVTQPMSPTLSLKNAYPFRKELKTAQSVPADRITSPDEQPVLGETFGMQVHVVPEGMEDELDVHSIKVYMSWFAGTSPWGYKAWRNLPGAVTGIELKPASDWSESYLVYRSSPDDASAFIPPQLAGDEGYQVVQYFIWAEFANKNGVTQEVCELDKAWVQPSWYRPIDLNRSSGGAFSAYTVLDSISPERAWINEINMFDGDIDDTKHQYIEIAVPQGFDMTGWSLNHIKMDGSYTLYPLADIGYDTVGVKTADATNSYAFLAIQSPKTKSANSYPGLDDGVWKSTSTAFDNGEADISRPYALQLVRPIGIIEHELVTMSTNTSTSRTRYVYDGTNFLEEVKKNVAGDWFYAGADMDGGSLGVFTNHGESAGCWTNSMKQTPGKVNMLYAGGPCQFIDPDYFDPPGGTNLWIYANIANDSRNTLAMVFGSVTNTTAVIIVPQGPDGTFSTSIVYSVTKWFEMDDVVTNEYLKPGGSVAGVAGRNGTWTLDLSGIRLSDPDARKFEVLASTRDSSKIADLGEKGISKDDPYYPAVVKWLQDYDEKDISLARYWTVENQFVDTLNLKEMYWLNIPPVTQSGDWEWIFKAGMVNGYDSTPVSPNVATNVTAGGMVTNYRLTVFMMITNRLWAGEWTDERAPYPPDRLRGLEPGESSYGYDENNGNWTSVTFKIQGALQNGKVNNVWKPLRWFVFGPESFGAHDATNAFMRQIDVPDPFTRGSPGYAYDWSGYIGCPVLYRWGIDPTNGPTTVYQLNDSNALLDADE